nr:disintegrin and metalloproteinase domain-containing protein 9 [Misgurnus anguillicaudatus]
MARYIYIFILILIHCVLYNATDQILKNYKVVKPQLVHERWKRHSDITQTPEQETHADSVKYSININGSERLLHLTKNTEFLSNNFVMFTQDAEMNVKVHTEKPVLCHYQGYVEGYEDSLVALSTCDGLRGVIFLGNESYGVEPVPHSQANEHLLFLLKDNRPDPFVCGLANDISQSEDHSQQLTMSMFLRKKRTLPQTKYVELAIVVDHQRFVLKNQDKSAVQDEVVNLANLLDTYYKPLNIRIALTGLEIFDLENPFNVEGTAGGVLGNFVKWRTEQLLPRLRNDVSQLIVGRSGAYSGGALGMAFVGTVCSAHNGGAINVFSNKTSLQYFSTIMAHELGHNLGMSHDTSYCSCSGTKSCIMLPTASGSTLFSNCSDHYFEKLILNGGGACLRNQPSAGHIITTPKCMNGILERGEQCDCGTPEECKNKCCDAATCTLTKNSACAMGTCCQDCQILVSGSPCRPSVDPCDLPEFCNGTSEFCPSDFYIMDGLPCINNTAYCYEGRCQTFDYQCKQLFGSGARKADDKCFSYVNTQGNQFGNCGYSGSKYTPCAVKDAMCGKIQCLFDSNKPPAGAIVSVQSIEGDGGQITCMNADFNMGPDVPDPAYVEIGSACNPGEMCYHFTCQNASVLDQSKKCDARINCSNNGVCNDQFNCHCDNGWAPPNCNKGGRGGSINSGPAQIDYSLRNGLLIFFLLVVPVLVVLIVVLLYVFKRDCFSRCSCDRPSKRNMSSNAANGATNAQPNARSNANAARTSTPQSRTQPNTPSSYVVNTSVSHPRQGPGAPKPIPPRQTQVV